MAPRVEDPIISGVNYRSRMREVELPNCDELRASAFLTVVAQYASRSKLAEVISLEPMVQSGFALMGFSAVIFLLRDRVLAASRLPGGSIADRFSWARSLFRALPVSWVLGLVAVVLYLPDFLTMESLSIPELGELPALILRKLRGSFLDSRVGSSAGPLLIACPLVILMAPRRLLGPISLAILGAGLSVQFAGLLSSDLQPASIVVAPSPLDLMAAGALAAAILSGRGQADGGRLGHWATLMVLALAVGSIGFLTQERMPSWGVTTALSAPAGFGALNFILKIMGTTLVGSLAWRDIGR